MSKGKRKKTKERKGKDIRTNEAEETGPIIKKAILDSKFVERCMRKRIHFAAELQRLGLKLLIPKKTYHNLKNKRYQSNLSKKDKQMSAESLTLLKAWNAQEKKTGGVDLEKWLIQKGKEGFVIGTTKSKIKNQVPFSIDILESTRMLQLRKNPSL